LSLLPVVAKTIRKENLSVIKNCEPGVYEKLVQAGATKNLGDFRILCNYLRLFSKYYKHKEIDLSTFYRFVNAQTDVNPKLSQSNLFLMLARCPKAKLEHFKVLRDAGCKVNKNVEKANVRNALFIYLLSN
jgi:hypothetical protein